VFRYHPDTGIFRLAYRAKGPDGKRLSRRMRTRVYVPRSHYPDGYDAEATGARIVSDPGSRYLLLRRRAGAASVELTIRPRG
jgi:hypothetical protein